MGRHKSSPDDISRNALAQRRSRERRKARSSAEVGADLAGIMSDELADDPSSDSLTPAGLVSDYSGESSGSQSLEDEQALWVRRRREITELELAKRRGELVPIADVRTQSAAMGRRIRIALDKIPQHLPAHLSPEARVECEKAIAVAVSSVMATV